jgi:D-3-phosphoglycerate dehydrogenase
MKVAVTTSSFAQYDSAPLDILKDAGLEIIFNPHGRTMNAAEAREVISGCVGLLAGTEPLNAEVLTALPDLKVISRCGVDMGNVDLAFAEKAGLRIMNTPDAPARAVMELTLALIFDLARQVARQDRSLRSGIWKKRMGHLLEKRKIGVVGCGRIGFSVASHLRSLGCEVAAHDCHVRPEGFASLELDELLSWCDCLTLHCPALPDGKPLLTSEKLALLPPGAWVINTARGSLIDEEALYNALKSERLGGAALDVFLAEPYEGPLRELENVILTPHVGSYAQESRVGMELEAAENLLAGLRSMGLLS